MGLTAAALRRWPLPSLAGAGSKEDRGRVLVVGGAGGLPGSVMLAAEAALRAGAGKLQVATVHTVATAVAVQLPEAKVLALPARDGSISGSTPSLLKAARGANAVVIGCGMEESAASRRLVVALMHAARCPVLLDAGALNAAREMHSRPNPLLMTPHLGEMAALTDKDVEEVDAHQLDFARHYARKMRAALALKGATTVICDPDGKAWTYLGGTVGLGTSGSGDVLAGVVAGLLARGAQPAQALAWAVWTHGQAGRRLARRIGPVGFLARELLPEIPMVLRSLVPRAAAR